MELPASPAASAPASAGERWPPLESSPEVFNQFMWSLGVQEDEAEFHDVYGIDADALDMVPQPVLAVILCFPDPPQDASYSSDLLSSYGEKETHDQVYLIKQIESLGNACGTIALIHAVGNSYSEINLVENSCLDVFFKSTASMDPYERALFLEKDDAMAKAHSLAASAGVTELCDVVEEHYICFVAVNGTLNELDGMKYGPIKHGSSSSKSLLQDAVTVIKGIMRNIPDSISFNLMVLSRKQNNAVVLQVPKGMTKVTPKKSSFVSFSSQNRTSLFATDDVPPLASGSAGSSVPTQPCKKTSIIWEGRLVHMS